MAILLLKLLMLLSFSVHASESDIFDESASRFPVVSYPKTLSDQCNEGTARVYDECGSQRDIVTAAHADSVITGKTTLVVYGAEWCVWCHVFDDFVRGEFAADYYRWVRDEDSGEWVMRAEPNTGAEEQARELNRYVAENFVIVHIEGDRSSDGPSTISSLGFDEKEVGFYPFIFSLNSDGQYADHMLAYQAMPQNDSRKNEHGQPLNEFNRAVLLEQLKVLKASALGEP